MKKIKLEVGSIASFDDSIVFDIVLNDNGENKISSNLRFRPAEIDTAFDDLEDFYEFEEGVSVIEAMVLNHACSGVNVKSKEYLEGLKKTIEKVTQKINRD